MWLRLRRSRRRQAAGTPLAACWQHPTPAGRTACREAPFLVCDGEMSSLDPATGALLSLGWVAIEHGAIQLASARHYLIAGEQAVGQSATIHHIHDRELAQGAPISTVMEAFLQAAAGRVLVFHHAALDIAFLDRQCQRLYGAPLLLPTIDTLRLEQKQRERRNQACAPGALTLAGCRAHYGLPVHAAHNALLDAIATAELLLAQIAHRGRNTTLHLRDLR
ncbi:exonuclease domain-containing protein [Haliea sp.]|uniref:exonuclease domain-containing protein n=1 Tax=Haliea sp. TaxID=1932666 RepID=UPI003528DEBE